MAEAYPLEWPAGWKRTRRPGPARFNVSQAKGQKHLLDEIYRLGGRYPIISSNVSLRRDGFPYANQKKPEDTGVAVYFEHEGKQKVFACDQYNTVGDNIRAIGKTIEAIRGIERWGASDLLERTLSAFDALPPPSEENTPVWPVILGIAPDASVETIEAAFRRKAREAHPDMTGGSADAFKILTAAKEAAITQQGGKAHEI